MQLPTEPQPVTAPHPTHGSQEALLGKIAPAGHAVDGADAPFFNSNIEAPATAYGETVDPTSNPIQLIDDMSFYDWGNTFWSDWLFPNGVATDGLIPPYNPLNDAAPAANQGSRGIATTAPNPEVTEVGQTRESLHETITSILPLPYSGQLKNSWPFASADDAEPLQSMPRLNAASRASEVSYFHLPVMTDTTFDNILQAVKIPTTHPPWRPLSLEGFPTSSHFDECIDLYFANFHPSFPFIHRPSFDVNKNSLLVTLGMVSIGACYSEREGAHDFATALAELNRRLLLFMGEYDPRCMKNTDYVTAQVLGFLFGICSGNRRHFELSESLRSTLVNQGTSMGLFDEIKASASVDPSTTSLWSAWIQEETLCRLGWAIYEIDASVTFLLNKRPYLSVSSMRLQLPSSEDLWEADSAQAWASLHPSSPLAPLRKSFPAVLGLVFTGRDYDENIRSVKDPQHRHFLIVTLARMVWSIKEIQTVPGARLGRFPIEQFQETKRELLSMLETFRLDMTPALRSKLPSSVGGMLRSCLITHVSNLYAADDLMDWFYPLIRRGHVAARWKTRAAQWASQHPIKVREVAYHSAQILTIARKFPINVPAEVLDTFHAGLYLWLVSGLWQDQQNSTSLQAGEQATEIRLDVLHFESSDDGCSNLVAQWIKDGSATANTRVSIHGVPDLAGLDGPRHILQQVAKLLERMKVWKISQNLLRIVLGLLPEIDVMSP